MKLVGRARAGRILGVMGLVAGLVAACSSDSGDGDNDDGPGSAASPLCDKSCGCFSCDDEDLVDCEDELTAATAIAEQTGCTQALEDTVSCVLSTVACKDGKLELDPCEAQGDALNACTGDQVKLDNGDKSPIKAN